ncbi:MAG: hypothetical protein IKE42_28930 [Aquamicrobium sp.]|uniref:hypothetical protein n=1 Tax=Mesorhizobium sp. Pch-S TaxID=2082387 RepID=UPI00101391A1|nr:hypothetical protein [Mesorhizobium sp. Pch-S]MBR2691900.1 hypothetical protein [Aquamicrobium sp.]QAZ42963.1 hypothetical protein C1M53_08230 [Mesorhizobium sp. Pch-S]
MAKSSSPTGLRQFLSLDHQQEWLDGKSDLPDSIERTESLEHRFKYAARFEKLLRRPQGREVLDLLRLYGPACIPIPRQTERFYWSVSCLPSTSDKPLVRVNASWMELFTLYADGEGVRARFILHLSDFTTDGSATPNLMDQAFLEQSVAAPEDLSWFFPSGPDMFIVKLRGAASIRQFIANPRALRAIRNFNLTHMNRGRNAYQASHSYSVADHMLPD